MILLSGPDVLLRNLLSNIGVLHGSAQTPSAKHSCIEWTRHGNFGGIWWLELHIIICNREGIKLSGYGGTRSVTGLNIEIYDAEGNRLPVYESSRSRVTRMKSKSNSFEERKYDGHINPQSPSMTSTARFSKYQYQYQSVSHFSEERRPGRG